MMMMMTQCFPPSGKQNNMSYMFIQRDEESPQHLVNIYANNPHFMNIVLQS